MISVYAHRLNIVTGNHAESLHVSCMVNTIGTLSGDQSDWIWWIFQLSSGFGDHLKADIMEMSRKACWAIGFAYLWNPEVWKHSIFFQVLIHIDSVLGPVHCQFVGNLYWCLKVWQDNVFAFDFLLNSSLCGCVMVLWRVCWHVCKFLCINLWFQYPFRFKHEIDHRSSKDTRRLEDRNIRMIEFERKTTTTTSNQK